MSPGDTVVRAFCIQGTVSKMTPEGGVITTQNPTFYLLPDVNCGDDPATAAAIARRIINPFGDPTIVPNVDNPVLVTLHFNDTEK